MKIYKCDKSKCEEKKPDEYPLSYNEILMQEGIYAVEKGSSVRLIVLKNKCAPKNPAVLFYCAPNKRLEPATFYWAEAWQKFKLLPNAKLIMEVVDE